MILEINNLSVSYYSKKTLVCALNNINLHLEQGEILSVVGESGSGKSTLAFSLLNLLPHDAQKKGAVYFKGENIFCLKDKQIENLRGKQIGLVFQEPSVTFNPVLSINYQFQEILKTRMNIRTKEERTEIIIDIFKKVHLDDCSRILNSYSHQLSGGELQRIAIAMAISFKPDILICDEPTSSLDVTIESQIIHLFKELKETLNLTLLFITHNLELAKILSDRVAVLHQGVLREVNNKQELFDFPQDKYTKQLLSSFRELEG